MENTEEVKVVTFEDMFIDGDDATRGQAVADYLHGELKKYSNDGGVFPELIPADLMPKPTLIIAEESMTPLLLVSLKAGIDVCFAHFNPRLDALVAELNRVTAEKEEMHQMMADLNAQLVAINPQAPT